MLVKIKKEIIAFGVESIHPEKSQPCPHVKPRQLLDWLRDEKEEVVLLDTRNDYEYELGTFQGAVTLDLQHFRDFPNVVKDLPESLKGRKIVTFCTGGVRCEKAGPYLIQNGFSNVYQLHGGILKYFEDCGSEHYDGDCYVFDKRVALDPNLSETKTIMCFACRQPLSPELQTNLPNCPKCGKNVES
eukprot:CAMPEP_0113942288 /NCGR_PEP_ID=MMETSP1339-20121228/8028_1 /TAXON_ID=94617 /ORGANISM="Fibrocapsa japonica" /LENGTH=186 /DNA_ID=CAMNT_0000946691 /DNA_START=297 /DNA_END=857 /DNA_ORIENTATION=- /assembly_acc=CAM_ASM_000762